MCNVLITKQRCGKEGFNELKVAFGDMTNCQLKCPFCFTREQKKATEDLSGLYNYTRDQIITIRFTGGEPFISQNQTRGITKELSKIEKCRSKSLQLIIVQTNGLDVKKRDLDFFKTSKLPILFEISLKGTNVEEYRFLTFEKPITQRNAKKILQKQYEGYFYLTEMFEKKVNIQILARLGIFHSSITKPMFKFVYPEDNERIMFNPENWDNKIFEIYTDQRRLWNKTFDKKMVVEKIKTGADGRPAMGQRYRRIIDDLKMKDIMIEDVNKMRLPKSFSEKYYYKRGNAIYGPAQNFIKNRMK